MNNLINDKNTKSYYFENDKDYLSKYEDRVVKLNEKEDFAYHLDVLPQPFFGEIEAPKILIIANNPSYVKWDDEFDRDLYLRKK